jgi:Fe-S cluster assembly protein SufD
MSTAASGLCDAFERFAGTLPEAERTVRRALFDAFLAQGLPRPELENWHYTDLSALAGIAFEPAAAANAELGALELDDVERLVYVNGHLDRAASTRPDLHGGSLATADAGDAVLALNGAFALPGLSLKLPARSRLERPLHLLLLCRAVGGPAMTHQQHLIELGAAAEASLVLDFRGAAGPERLVTHRFRVQLAHGAQLRLYRVQDEAVHSTLITHIDVQLAGDASLQALCFDRGGGLVRHDLRLSLDGTGAAVELDGLYAPRAGAHVDNQSTVIHAAPRGRSRERFRGIVDERARAVFNGRVLVRPGAQKTDSEQHIANLLLSPRAEVDAKPELEIYADDVRCTHGATVGQLDHGALSYLRSRGLDPDRARALLLRAFAAEVLERISLPQLRTPVAALFGLPPVEELEA